MSNQSRTLSFLPVSPEAMVRPATTAMIQWNYGVASFLGLIGLLMGVPSIWNLLYEGPAIVDIPLIRDYSGEFFAAAVACFFFGQRLISRARLKWNTKTQITLAATRQAAWKQNIWLDVEISDSFPRVMISRRDRVIALAGHDSVMIPADSLVGVGLTSTTCPGIINRQQPVVELRLETEAGQSSIYVSAGDGIVMASMARASGLRDQLLAYQAELAKPVTQIAIPDNVVPFASILAAS
jgi:hypothetical protein